MLVVDDHYHSEGSPLLPRLRRLLALTESISRLWRIGYRVLYHIIEGFFVLTIRPQNMGPDLPQLARFGALLCTRQSLLSAVNLVEVDGSLGSMDEVERSRRKRTLEKSARRMCNVYGTCGLADLRQVAHANPDRSPRAVDCSPRCQKL